MATKLVATVAICVSFNEELKVLIKKRYFISQKGIL